ncbi:MAG: phosphatase PAP2 family protein [Alphaproteobacteria bacterium]|nr:phosphatase PAP2 family protein [Alphaproteobacteria bacterium]
MAVFFIVFVFLLAVPVFWPSADLFLSGLFHEAGRGFPLADSFLFQAVHELAFYGARVLALAFMAFLLVALVRRKKVFLSSKAWIFLFLALVIGPGLVANAGFKDHWGRPRPREVVAFGGTERFLPIYEPQFDGARSNGSFVCGDGAFGFFLTAFAFVVPYRLTRRAFAAAVGLGLVFSFVRLAMGAHFFSDIVYAALLMFAVNTALFALFYGRREAWARWRAIICGGADV